MDENDLLFDRIEDEIIVDDEEAIAHADQAHVVRDSTQMRM